jgi:hypothetical protein
VGRGKLLVSLSFLLKSSLQRGARQKKKKTKRKKKMSPHQWLIPARLLMSPPVAVAAVAVAAAAVAAAVAAAAVAVEHA